MYYRKLETNAAAKAEWNEAHRKIAGERFASVAKAAAIKRRLKKSTA